MLSFIIFQLASTRRSLLLLGRANNIPSQSCLTVVFTCLLCHNLVCGELDYFDILQNITLTLYVPGIMQIGFDQEITSTFNAISVSSGCHNKTPHWTV